MQITINECLIWLTQAQSRIKELTDLQKEVCKKERYYGPDKTIEPTYDVKKVANLIVELRRFTLKLQTQIKQSNATTKVDLDVSSDVIFKNLD